ncbi:MAG: response regulator transcription factor [Algiphilus sp.]|uniref:response regulator n=1 Tax=Algiphilus sp. TaxID=1872431 RepID=UPI0025C42DF0|nr:response regulator transcription factor [Algiphilus sp.]MCI5103397.1 response regulator transcription factor [Algiphilus sp.]
MSESAPRVLLVDDHAVVRAGHRALLEATAAFTVVAEAENGEQALRIAATTPLDLAILDLELPGISGLETCERLSRQHPHLGLLLVTVHDSPLLQTRARRAGARGFVSKRAPAEHLLAAITAVANGTSAFAASPDEEDTAGGVHTLAQLSDREFEILRLLAAGASVARVAETLHLSPKTVSNLLSGLRSKLGIRERQGLIRFALRHGLGGH